MHLAGVFIASVAIKFIVNSAKIYKLKIIDHLE